MVVKSVAESIEAVKSGITDKYNLFVVCETVEGAARLVKELGVEKLNLGGTKPGEGKKELGAVVHVDEQEEKLLKELQEKGVYVYIQMIPESKEISCKGLLDR